MLVLSRKTGEKIYIGEDVFVEVRRVAGNRVTLAINAPKSVANFTRRTQRGCYRLRSVRRP